MDGWCGTAHLISTHGGAQTSFTCDDLGRTIGIERPDGTLRTIAYDGLDRPVSMTDFDGQLQQFSYTPEGWLEREERGTSVRTYEYNALGKPVRVSTDGIDSILTYDEQGRLTARTFENGRTVGYRYYPSGARERVIDSLGGVVRYSYDRQGRIDTLTDGGGRVLADYAYDPDTGLPVELIHGTDAPDTPHTVYDYDEEGRITGINTTADGTDLITENYVYNTYGEMQTRTMARGDLSFTESYGYTGDQLLETITRVDNATNTTIDDITYGYDTRGNRISETHDGANPRTIAYTVNNMNQLISRTTRYQQTGSGETETNTSFAYDEAGRLISTQVTDHESHVTVVDYGYDEFGRRSSVSGPMGEASYQYTFDGKRISRYANGTLLNYTWDTQDSNSRLIDIQAENGGRVASYAYGNQLVAQIDANGATQPVVTDFQGSVIGVLGFTPATFAYDPYGNTIHENDPTASPQHLSWLSRLYDVETDDYYLINRYYSAGRGTFTSPDQYRYVDPQMPYSLNLYQYGYSSPMMYMDRDGLKAVAELIDTVSLYQDWYDYINPDKWIMHMVGGKDAEIYYIYDDGIPPIEINNQNEPMAISFGILTTEPDGLNTALRMAKDVQRPSYYITNYSGGFEKDVVESIKTKVFGINSATVEAMKRVLAGEYTKFSINDLKFKLPIEWIVHSQGGIHLSEALKETEHSYLVDIDVISTFGAAAWHYEKDPKKYVHYVSTRDAVSFLFGKTAKKMRTDETKIIGNFGWHMFMSGYWQQYLLENGYYYQYLSYYEEGSREWSLGMDKFSNDERTIKRSGRWIDKHLAEQGYYYHQ